MLLFLLLERLHNASLGLVVSLKNVELKPCNETSIAVMFAVLVAQYTLTY